MTTAAAFSLAACAPYSTSIHEAHEAVNEPSPVALRASLPPFYGDVNEAAIDPIEAALIALDEATIPSAPIGLDGQEAWDVWLASELAPAASAREQTLEAFVELLDDLGEGEQAEDLSAAYYAESLRRTWRANANAIDRGARVPWYASVEFAELHWSVTRDASTGLHAWLDERAERSPDPAWRAHAEAAFVRALSELDGFALGMMLRSERPEGSAPAASAECYTGRNRLTAHLPEAPLPEGTEGTPLVFYEALSVTAPLSDDELDQLIEHARVRLSAASGRTLVSMPRLLPQRHCVAPLDYERGGQHVRVGFRCNDVGCIVQTWERPTPTSLRMRVYRVDGDPTDLTAWRAALDTLQAEERRALLSSPDIAPLPGTETFPGQLSLVGVFGLSRDEMTTALNEHANALAECNRTGTDEEIQGGLAFDERGSVQWVRLRSEFGRVATIECVHRVLRRIELGPDPNARRRATLSLRWASDDRHAARASAFGHLDGRTGVRVWSARSGADLGPSVAALARCHAESSTPQDHASSFTARLTRIDEGTEATLQVDPDVDAAFAGCVEHALTSARLPCDYDESVDVRVCAFREH